METFLNCIIAFFTGVGAVCTILFLMGKFKNRPRQNIKLDFNTHVLPHWIANDPMLYFDKPHIDYEKYKIPEKPELPTDIFKFYYQGEFICEIQRKDKYKIEGIYDLVEIKLILNNK